MAEITSSLMEQGFRPSWAKEGALSRPVKNNIERKKEEK
jgi:hypothetical protein